MQIQKVCFQFQERTAFKAMRNQFLGFDVQEKENLCARKKPFCNSGRKLGFAVTVSEKDHDLKIPYKFMKKTKLNIKKQSH